MIASKPDILSVIEPYADLKKRGPHYWALCPLPGHLEGTASFKVDPQRQSFYCFGCRAGGDVITFIQKYKKLSFKEALSYLGINGKPYKPNPKETRRRELLKKFQQWCDEYFDDLCSLNRCLWKAKQNVKSIEDAEKLAEYYRQEPVWLYRIEVLQGSDDEQKLQLYKEVRYGN
jgi:hypothetical protein